jgi:predicted pyridoxine 5'-phosphate oxidase superfamily flavin-nucleotide-binding protein
VGGQLRESGGRPGEEKMMRKQATSDQALPEAEPALPPDEVMFSPAVRAKQECHGSRQAHAQRAAAGGFAQELSADAMAFIGQRNSAYLATASADGHPYVQHRGGPPGFLKVLDNRTVAFAEYRGNRQYISAGHLAENAKSFLFLMDYEHARRLKLWGRAKIADEPALLARLATPAQNNPCKRAIVFTVMAWDWNCSRHIPKLVPAEPRS